MNPSLDRKEQEKILHDQLRGDRVDDPHFTSNKKFYSISSKNTDYVKKWLAERCRGKSVLDYCCGNGEFTLWLAAADARPTGIDISPVSIENANRAAAERKLSDRTAFQVMDAENMTFADNTFDFAVVSGVLHHLDLDKAYRELARVLKPDGAVICTEALRHNPAIHLYRKMTPHLRSAWEVDHILGKPEIEQARRYFHRVSVTRFFHLATLIAIPFRNWMFFPFLLRVLSGVDAVLLNVPYLKWQAWMGVFVLSHPRKESTETA